MKRLLLSMLAMLAVVNLSAQDFRFGVTGAVNLSWVHTPIISSDAYVGFNAGVKAEMDMSDVIMDGFFVDGRLLYNLKGGSWAGSHQNLGYLEIPLNFGYRYHVNNNVALMAGVGPYFGFGIIGKDVSKDGDTKIKTDMFGHDVQRFDFGLNYNIGVEMWQNWQFFAGFEHGLLNIAKSSAEDDILPVKFKLHNFYIGVAYMF